MNEAFLERLRNAVEENIQKKDFGVDELGREIGMSRSQIHRKLQSITGQSASRFIRSYKMEKARELLRGNVATVSEISYDLGFSSPAYFGQVYTEEFGYPPSEEKNKDTLENPTIKEGGQSGTIRRLAAIMFTDIVDYSAIMGRDEQKALELIQTNRAIQQPLVEKHHGKWLKELGDGVLAQFDSAYDSVLCALDIQREAKTGFDGKIRIGIHLGDVTIDRGDVIGDGVNIASRLQGIADPGGIYISESIQKAIRGRTDIQTRHLGDAKLKNIDFLVETYCLVGDGLPLPSPDKIRQFMVAAPAEKKGVYAAHANDNLIREVFDALVKVKPALSRFLYLDEDEDEGDVDVRLLADQIIRNYPWVISIELRRLFSGSMRTLDSTRLDQMYRTIERSLQFLSFIMVIELCEKVRDGEIKTEKGFVTELNERFRDLSFSDFVWLIQSIGKLFSSMKKECFFPEMKEMLGSGFPEILDFDLPSRTETGHYQINDQDEEVERLCFEFIEKLAIILKEIAFITKYRLVTIKEIKVLKRRHRNAMFEHWIDILNSFDSDFSSKEEVFDTFSDSNAVLLMKSLKQPRDFLNLSPLIIDTRTEVIDSKEKFDLKKDIFIYSQFRDNKMLYAGTEVKEKVDLSNLGNYDELIMDFHDLLKMDSKGNSKPKPTE